MLLQLYTTYALFSSKYYFIKPVFVLHLLFVWIFLTYSRSWSASCPSGNLPYYWLNLPIVRFQPGTHTWAWSVTITMESQHGCMSCQFFFSNRIYMMILMYFFFFKSGKSWKYATICKKNCQKYFTNFENIYWSKKKKPYNIL